MHQARVLACVVLTALPLWAGSSSDVLRQDAENAVRRGEFIRYQTLTGEIQASQSMTIRTPPVSSIFRFTITHMVPEGEAVEAGQVVTEFDASDLELRRLDLEKKREEARLEIDRKKAEIEGRRQDQGLEKARALKDLKISQLKIGIDTRLIARSEVERNKFDFENAKIALEKAEERLANLEQGAKSEMELVQLEFKQADLELRRVMDDLELMKVRSTYPGLVLYQDNWSTGRKFQVGDQLFKGQTLMRIPNLDRLEVSARLHHSDVAHLSPGAPAEVILDAYPERVFKGRVASLSKIAKSRSFRSQFKFFNVTVDLEEMDPAVMKPGMTARVRIARSIPQALMIPRRTLGIGSDGEAYVMKEGQPPQRVAVNPIDANPQWVAVEADLNAGERLVDLAARDDQGGDRSIEWIPVESKDLDFNVSGSGLLRAAQSVFIGPPSLANAFNFKIARMAPEGINVKKGDFLVQFDPMEFMTRLRDERSNLSKVAKEIEKTESSFAVEIKDLELAWEQAKVDREKAENKLINARQFESYQKVQEALFEAEFTRFNVEAQQKKLESRKIAQELQLRTLKEKMQFYEARVASSQRSLQALSVTAPIDGVLVYQTDWNNEKKKVGDQVYTRDKLFGIPNLETLRIEGQVSEVDAGRIKIGQPVSVTLDALPEEAFSGKVVEIGTIFRNVSFNLASKVLDVVVELDKVDPRRMRPGMAARIKIVVDRFSGVTTVPLSVIQIDEEGSFVWVKQGEEAVKTAVTVGKDNGIVAVIESGLSDGDQVASRPVRSTVQ